MKGPSLLSDHLTHYEACATDRDLFQALILQLDDLIQFFELVCEDEQWALQHSKFVRLVLHWAAKQFYLGNLSLYYARSLVKIIQNHYSLLQPFLFFRAALFFTVKLRIKDETVLVNSLLFGIESQVLRNIFKRECFEKLNDEWILYHMRMPTFQLIETYFYKGESPDLWKYDHGDILTLMAQAQDWELHPLIKDCAVTLGRYIQEENVVETVLKAHQQGFNEWKEEAYAFFNKHKWGLRFLSGNSSELKIEFLNFQPETLELFRSFAHWTTHLAFKDRLSEELEFQTTLNSCPDLRGVDLNESLSYAGQFAFLPAYLQDLSLSACAWLRPDHFRQAAAQCPHVKKLELADNRHLNYLAWGELYHFKQLRDLNLARCIQLTNEDLHLIHKGSPLLSVLNIEECRKIDDHGIEDLAMHCPYLQELNLSHCDQLTDQALITIGLHLPQLVGLRLVQCEELTDQGLLQLVKVRPSLTFLDIQGCHFSLRVLNNIQKMFPLLNLKLQTQVKDIFC